MILYPAIDVSEGRAVRLRKGDFDQRTVYWEDPLDAARAFEQAGARFLHVVDLDGAKAGRPLALAHVERIVAAIGLPLQLGGGLRTIDAVRDAFAAGVARVVLGTAAFSDSELLDQALAEHGERVVVSVDTRGGMVATEGWIETTQLPAAAAIERLGKRGVQTFVYTDVDRDGMLEGPDLDGVRALAAVVDGALICSGGIGALADLEALAGLGAPSLAGVIVGKALYEGRFTVAQGQAALER